MDGLKFLEIRHKHPAKCGRLKYANIEAPDLDQLWQRRLCRAARRFMGRYRLSYDPCLSKYDIIYVPDDSTPHNGYLVKRAKSEGVTTAVIQHGFPGSLPGFLPLRADYFLCWPECRDKFISWGMPARKILTFQAQVPNDLNFICDLEAVFFLTPPAKGRLFEDEWTPRLYTEKEIVEVIEDIASDEPNLLLKPHPRFYKYLKPYLKDYNVTWERAEDLIYSAKRIYTFEPSTTIKDCEVLGKKATVVK